MLRDEAAAELDLLSVVHRSNLQRRRPQRGPRLDVAPLTPRRVAERAAARTDEARFFNAMTPTERTDLLENLAEKIAGGIIEDMGGVVELLNGARERVNEGRRARGTPQLPLLDLDAGRIRGALEQGIEAALDKGLHSILKTTLDAIFGAPSRLPREEGPASSLGPLPDHERIPSDQGLHLTWRQSF